MASIKKNGTIVFIEKRDFRTLSTFLEILYHKMSIQKVSQVKFKMAKIINLNKKRKEKNDLAKEKKSIANRITFGRTKKEKQMAARERDRDERWLDGHKLAQKDNDQE